MSFLDTLFQRTIGDRVQNLQGSLQRFTDSDKFSGGSFPFFRPNDQPLTIEDITQAVKAQWEKEKPYLEAQIRSRVSLLPETLASRFLTKTPTGQRVRTAIEKPQIGKVQPGKLLTSFLTERPEVAQVREKLQRGEDLTPIEKQTADQALIDFAMKVTGGVKQVTPKAIPPIKIRGEKVVIPEGLESLAKEAGSAEEFKSALAKQVDETGTNIIRSNFLFHVSPSKQVGGLKAKPLGKIKDPVVWLNPDQPLGGMEGFIYAIDKAKLGVKKVTDAPNNPVFKLHFGDIPKKAVTLLGKRTDWREPFDLVKAFYNQAVKRISGRI